MPDMLLPKHSSTATGIPVTNSINVEIKDSHFSTFITTQSNTNMSVQQNHMNQESMH